MQAAGDSYSYCLSGAVSSWLNRSEGSDATRRIRLQAMGICRRPSAHFANTGFISYAVEFLYGDQGSYSGAFPG